MRSPRLLAVLGFSALLGLSALALNAQEHGTAPGPAASLQEHAAPAQPDAHPATTEGHAAPAEGTGHTAAHEGGHDATGHHGPEVKLPFMHRGLTPNEQFALKMFNFLVFALLLILPLKGVLGAAFQARAQELEERLTQAEKEKAEGEAQVRELEARMAGLEGELAGILAKADSDAAAEKERVLEAARAEAKTILAMAQAEIDVQRRNAEQELRALVAELAVEGATQRFRARLEGAQAAALVDHAIDRISQRSAEGGIH